MLSNTPVVLIIEDDQDEWFRLENDIKNSSHPISAFFITNVEDLRSYLSHFETDNNPDDIVLPNLILMNAEFTPFSFRDIMMMLRVGGSHRDIPVVVMVSSPEEEDMIRAVEPLEMVGFAVKPVTVEKLMNLIRNTVA